MYLTAYIYVYISQYGVCHFIFLLLFQFCVKTSHLNNGKISLVLFLYIIFFSASSSALRVLLEQVTLFFCA